MAPVDSEWVKASRLWHALTQQRRHRALDLPLGFFTFLTFVGGLAYWGPQLALALAVAVAAGYLIALRRRKPEGPRTPPDASPMEIRDAGDALAALDGVLGEAPGIPLTTEVRVDPDSVRPAVEMVRAEAAGTPSSAQAEELAKVLLEGRPVPMADQIRVDRDRAQRLLARLRSSAGR